jgi:hypothetical protein
MPHPSLLLLVGIGLGAGLLSGVFGIGGGVVIIPALVYLAGFDQHLATGTSLAILLPPIGLAGAVEYYRQGQVNVRAALVIALALAVGAWMGAAFGSRLQAGYLRIAFAGFVLLLGVWLLVSALRQQAG